MDAPPSMIDSVLGMFFERIEAEDVVPPSVILKLKKLAEDGQLLDAEKIEEAMKDGDLQNGHSEVA